MKTLIMRMAVMAFLCVHAPLSAGADFQEMSGSGM